MNKARYDYLIAELTSLNKVFNNLSYLAKKIAEENNYPLPDFLKVNADNNVNNTSTSKSISELAIEYALKEEAKGIKEFSGNNDNPEIYKYHKQQIKAAWCASFVSWCVEQATKQLGLETLFYTPAVINIYSIAKQKHWSISKTPKKGDIVIWGLNQTESWANHTGIVISVNGNEYKTVEGNSGNTIKINTHNLNDGAKFITLPKK